MSTPCRHSIYCILPPHILKNIAKNTKDAKQREAALNALSVDHSIRSDRTTFSLLGGLQVAHAVGLTAATPAVHRTIYVAGNREKLPGTLARSEGQAPVKDKSVNNAYDGLGATFDFYLAAYQRNSIDNQGLPLKATVHYGDGYNNAFWNGQQMVFGDGDGSIFGDFTAPLDVIGHELTHGVTGSQANLTYQGQAGALNESISDVFGSLVKQYAAKQTANQADWLIGKGLLLNRNDLALRSMAKPGSAYENDPLLGSDPQPAAMLRYDESAEDNGGVHINSGIPNHAFYLAATAIGGFAWVKAGQIWYDTLLDARLKQSADFAAFANLTVMNAAQRYGTTSIERKAVIDAWTQVGVPVQAHQAAVAG
ncbi:MAG: M4 family metallopeptidase [Acidobacteriia bacterium]|nr:M4 family metallopeptidase [Terriglobia bacterium]